MLDVTKRYRAYVLGSLTVVCALNYLDRGLMILLLQPIKEDLHLSDTQLGFLTGIAFGLFYAVLGVPIARWADRGNRVNIASLAIALWGLTVMSCVFVVNFAQLAFARVAAAVGESGCMPPTYSIVGDYFPQPAERTRAMSVYMLASPLASLVSFTMGGALNEAYGWRVTFFLLAIPAVLVALLLKMTVKEPRALSDPTNVLNESSRGMLDILANLWRQHSSRHLCIAIIILFTMGFGLGPWYAAFMIRSHAMGTAELGMWLGIIFGAGGMAGILFGGYVTVRWFAKDEGGQMRASALMIVAMVPCFGVFLLAPGKAAALVALTGLVLVSNFFFAPTFALMQRLVVEESRATTLALVMLMANLLGMGVGPQIVGVLSDRLAPVLGSDSLRYAMLSMSCVAFWGAYHFWQVSKTVAADLSDVACVSAGQARTA